MVLQVKASQKSQQVATSGHLARFCKPICYMRLYVIYRSNQLLFSDKQQVVKMSPSQWPTFSSVTSKWLTRNSLCIICSKHYICLLSTKSLSLSLTGLRSLKLRRQHLKKSWWFDGKIQFPAKIVYAGHSKLIQHSAHWGITIPCTSKTPLSIFLPSIPCFP